MAATNVFVVTGEFCFHAHDVEYVEFEVGDNGIAGFGSEAKAVVRLRQNPVQPRQVELVFRTPRAAESLKEQLRMRS